LKVIDLKKGEELSIGPSVFGLQAINLFIFFLTRGHPRLIFVNTMNNKTQGPSEKLAAYQGEKLKELIESIIHCCQERVLFQSQKFNLTPAELRCILLFKSEKYLTVKGIAQKLEVAKSRVTKIMEGLIEKRLIQYIDDPEDGRVKLFNLTTAGQKKTDEIDGFIKEIHNQLLVNLKVEDRDPVLHSLGILRSSMENVKERLLG
jgi:DNA-binding MarR family transcriptional regulator